MSKHPDIAKVRAHLVETGYPEDGDAMLSLAAVEAELEALRPVPVESLGREADAVDVVDRLVNGHTSSWMAGEKVSAAVAAHSRQYCKQAMVDAANLIEAMAAHVPPAEPVASVPDGWAAPNALTEEMIEAADDAHVAAYSDPSVPVSLEALHRAIYEAFRGASPGKIQGCGGCEGRGVVTDGDLSGDIWKAQCRGCNGRGWHVDAALSTTPPTNQEGAAP